VRDSCRVNGARGLLLAGREVRVDKVGGVGWSKKVVEPNHSLYSQVSQLIDFSIVIVGKRNTQSHSQP
jgi:hypothetical protein